MKRIIARDGNRVTYEYPSRVTKDAETGAIDTEYNGGTRVVHVVSAEPIAPGTTNAEHTQRVAETACRIADNRVRAAEKRHDEDAATIASLRRRLVDAEDALAAQERIAAGLSEEVGRYRGMVEEQDTGEHELPTDNLGSREAGDQAAESEPSLSFDAAQRRALRGSRVIHRDGWSGTVTGDDGGRMILVDDGTHHRWLDAAGLRAVEAAHEEPPVFSMPMVPIDPDAEKLVDGLVREAMDARRLDSATGFDDSGFYLPDAPPLPSSPAVDPEADTQPIPRVKSEPPKTVLGED